jgi:hypothetical protein
LGGKLSIKPVWESRKEEYMKKHLLIFFMLISVSILAVAYADQKAAMKLKVGDEVYACNCGIECKCNTMSNKVGSCTCGKDMVKAKVVRIEGGTAYLKADNWNEERPFNTTGKYVCSCGPTCKCNAISQNPGKCPCGTEMKKAD